MPTQFPAAFDAFIEPARARSQIWHTLAGFVMFALAYIILIAAVAIAVFFILEYISVDLGYTMMPGIAAGETVFATFAMLSMVGLMILPLWLILGVFHKRPLRSLLGAERKINWRMWGTAVAIMFALGALDAGITFATKDVTQQMPVPQWLIWMVPAIVILFAQTTAEELVFRGYLQQQLAARFQSRWIWMVLPSALFGIMHFSPDTFGNNTWLVVANAFVMGLIAADLTARLGNLSAAMGLHFANNFLVMEIMNMKGQLSGVSLFLFEADLKSAGTGVAIGISLIAMPVIYSIFVIIHRRRRL
ncbi:MAG: CPBP family intramembrane glutamic endopeptidase [Paracoccaceae bacterium]